MLVRPNSVVVIGGGLSGAAFALQAVEDAGLSVQVTIIEPREDLGAGLAFSTDDLDHRLNAPATVHYVLPEYRDRFYDRFVDAGGHVTDPDAEVAGRGVFIRRASLAKHIRALLQPHMAPSDLKRGIFHRRNRAIDLRDCGDKIQVILDTDEPIDAQAVVLATGNRPAPPPSPFRGIVEHHPSFFATPWMPERVRAIPRDGRILILGTALTTADVIATLVRQGHRGRIDAVSRRGLRPKGHRPPTGGPPPQLWNRIFSPVPAFLAQVQRETKMSDFVRLMRCRCLEVEKAGGTWYEAFDQLRDSLWQIWPLISADEKRRFMRHLRPWYDAHRFRIAPQIEQIVMSAEAKGSVVFRASRTVSVAVEGDRLAVGLRDRGTNLTRTEHYDAVINCTGTIVDPGDDPLSVALQASGNARPHASGVGWDADLDCRVIRSDGSPHRRLFVVGPPSAGVFGDPVAAPWIVAQIWRMIPGVRATFNELEV